MLREGLVRQFFWLRGIERFQHKDLPNIYYDNVGAHVVRLNTAITSFQDSYPVPNTIQWRRVHYISDHHDDLEKITGDKVVFAKGRSADWNDGPSLKQIARQMRWPVKRTVAIADFECTVARLMGADWPLHCSRENIIVAVFDLIDAAQLFHLETVRGQHTREYREKAPLPKAALLVAPQRLLSFKRRIPQLCHDDQFNRRIIKEIQGTLRFIHGAWQEVPRNDKSLVMRGMMAIIENHI